MPAFNAAPFVGAAIDSLRAQTTHDWELIVADDGSTDTTAHIARAAAAADRRITVLDAPAPGAPRGPAEARLRALAHASGEWVVALDADDLIEPRFLSILLDRRRETGADAVLCRLETFSVEDMAESTQNSLDNARPFKPEASFDTAPVYAGPTLLEATYGCWKIAANGLWLREIYTRASERALAAAPGNVYADELVGRLALCACERVAFAPAKYFYRTNPKSVTHKPSLHLYDILVTNRLLREFVAEEFPADAALIEVTRRHAYTTLVGCMMDRVPRAERRKALEMLREAYDDIDPATLPGRGPILRIMRLGFGPARRLISLYGRLLKK